MASAPLIDWPLTARLAPRWAPPGPQLSMAERVAVIDDLIRLSDEAHHHAVTVSGLADPGAPIGVQVLGRAGWVEANTLSMQAMLAPATPDDGTPPTLGQKVSARATAAAGSLALGWISARIVGQFDPFAPHPTLYYVAPNVIQIERELGVNRRDFRLWVAVHEQTHRLQFHTAPWLREELQSLVVQVVLDDDGSRSGSGVFTDRQQSAIDRATAVMSVLEGHAEVMMSEVGADVIGTVDVIRQRFVARRERGGMDALARKLLGMQMKMAQYRDGARFCRHVLERADRATLNRVWESPEHIPSVAELHAPDTWLSRVG